jgi:hypothetical protein
MEGEENEEEALAVGGGGVTTEDTEMVMTVDFWRTGTTRMAWNHAAISDLEGVEHEGLYASVRFGHPPVTS